MFGEGSYFRPHDLITPQAKPEREVSQFDYSRASVFKLNMPSVSRISHHEDRGIDLVRKAARNVFKSDEDSNSQTDGQNNFKGQMYDSRFRAN